jgi:selenocysteine lyase/cysteine desulfurase
VPLDFSGLGLDLLACPGHKGLLGPLGTGALLVRAEVAEWLLTYREGGTGSESENPFQPQAGPDKFEGGSHNAPGLAGLHVAVQWLLARGVAALRAHERELCGRLIERLPAQAGLRWFGPRRLDERVGVLSVRVDGLPPVELSALLEERYGILTRSGLHCAPLAHRAIGTYEDGGTTRLSLGPFLEKGDMDAAAAALTELTRHAARV